jgi:MFS transporter, PHS family, inorganic phosphate transporter
MIASVFFMQPLGQIAGNIVSLIVVAASRSQGDEHLRKTVDSMWRWVIGLGVVPGVLAVAFRFAIPETPRFLLEVEDDPIKAEFDATPMFGSGDSTELESAHETWGSTASANSNSFDEVILPAPAMGATGEWSISGNAPPVTLNSHWTLSRKDIHQYFWIEGNWRTLFGTAMSWLILDFSFCKWFQRSCTSDSILCSTANTLHRWHRSFVAAIPCQNMGLPPPPIWRLVSTLADKRYR